MQCPIFDRYNDARLLGYFAEKPLSKLQGRILQIAYMTPVVATFDHHHAFDTQCSRVEFSWKWRESEDGYSMNAIFQTDAPLKDLMMLSQFMLPGETPRSAKERRYRMAYGG